MHLNQPYGAHDYRTPFAGGSFRFGHRPSAMAEGAELCPNCSAGTRTISCGVARSPYKDREIVRCQCWTLSDHAVRLQRHFKEDAMDTNPFPLVDVSGTPFECGRQHGIAVPERIAKSVALYRGQMERRGVSTTDQRRLARDFVPVIEAYEPRYLEEMRGIAAGAGIKVEDIVIVNCRTEMMFGYREMTEEPGKTDGCTGIVVLPEASADRRLIHAHNWDWREECAETGIVIRIRSDDGPDILAFVEAGGLARHGFNSHGLALTGNFLTSDRDYKQRGEAPLGLIRRKMLESANMAEAMRVLWAK